MNQWLQLVLILGIIGTLVYFASPNLQIAASDTIAETKANIRESQNEAKLNADTECREWAESFFPEKFPLYKPISGSAWQIEDKNFKWSDGGDLTLAGIYHEYNKGSSVGQNVNYYYSSTNRHGRSITAPLGHSRKIIAEDGTILGTDSFQVVFTVIEMIGEPSKAMINYHADFKMIEYELVSCNKVSQ